MIRWLLVDYGEVLSAPLPKDTIGRLAGLASQDPADFIDRYWSERLAYDLGETPLRYWSKVLGRDLADRPDLVELLTRVDIEGWLHPNAETLPVLRDAADRIGAGLALMSNAPEPLALAIEGSDRASSFSRRFYSCRIEHAKPDAAAFLVVLGELDATASEVLFIDDRAVNTAGAAALGLATITFTTAAGLRDELDLVITGA